MGQIIRIGMDTSKAVFQLHGVNAAEEVVLKRKLRRKEMVSFFERLPATVIAIEACGASHHWARLLGGFGHEVKLIAPQLAKPYVKRGKNDAADAEALCEAMSRPTMRFVPVKTAEQQAVLMLMGVRDRLIRNQTQLANAIRGYAAEFGLTAAKGIDHLAPLLDRLGADERVPALARELHLPGRGIRAAAGEDRKRRGQADGLAKGRAPLSPSHEDPWRWPDRLGLADDEDAGARDVQIGATVRCLDGLDAQRSFDRRKGQARRHHPSRRRRLARSLSHWRHRGGRSGEGG